MTNGILGLILFFGCVIVYILDIFPMAAVSVLGCILMVIFGLCSFTDAFGQFGNSAVFLTIGSMIIGGTIIESGMQELMGRAVQRFTRHGELLILTVVYWIAGLASAFLNNMTVLAMLIPVVYAVCSEDSHIDPRNIFMPMVSAAVMGGICTLVGSTQQLAAQGVLEQYGAVTFKVFDFTPMGAIVLIAGYLYCVFVGYPIGKKIWGSRGKAPPIQTAELEKIGHTGCAAPTSRKKITILILILILMILLYITEWIPAAVTAMLCATLCVLLGLIPQKKAFSHIDWNVIGRIGGSFGLAKGLEVSGGLNLITNMFLKIFGSDLSPYVLFVIVCALAMLLSEVMSNSVAILTVLPIVLAVANDFGLNVTAYAFGVVFAASFGMSCPLAGSHSVLIMQSDYTFRDFFRYGAALDLLDLTLTVIFVPILMPLTI